MDEQERLKEINFYKSALFSIEDQIAREKEGLILDSGTLLPHVVNSVTIRELENKAAECRIKLAELQDEGQNL